MLRPFLLFVLLSALALSSWAQGTLAGRVMSQGQASPIATVRIDPDSGQVVGMIDLAGLLAEEDRLRDTDVLNGIAMDPQSGDIWVTGKRWPWLYQIELVPQ